jgi:Collagen triple helix repeat (20 copies)
MFSTISKRLTYANVAMTLALVFAMSGGAYAAGKYLITSTKQISPKVLKSLVGKTGPAGKNGTNGTNGANGAPGEKGAQGPQGSQGPQGLEGKAGEPGKEGKAGANGTTGFTKTLPAGETETGTWGWFSSAGGAVAIPISFTIPLSAKLAETQVHYINEHGEEVVFPEPTHGLIFTGPTEEKKESTQCLGSAEEPTAAPGNLCVYTGKTIAGFSLVSDAFENPANEFQSAVETGTAGTVMLLAVGSAGEEIFGTWAVTAPAEA